MIFRSPRHRPIDEASPEANLESPLEHALALGHASAESYLVAELLRRIVKCEKAEAYTALCERTLRRRVDHQIAQGGVLAGTRREDLYEAAFKADKDWVNAIARQQWLDKRATMYATAALALRLSRTNAVARGTDDGL